MAVAEGCASGFCGVRREDGRGLARNKARSIADDRAKGEPNGS